MDVPKPIFDPSLLFDPSSYIKIFLRTDDIENQITEEDLSLKEEATSCFTYKEQQLFPMNFIGKNMFRNRSNITLSQNEHLKWR